jgi:1,4-alpha-glucan branching enzyme
VRLPAPNAHSVEVRFSSLLERDRFDQSRWRREPLRRVPNEPGWWSIEIDSLSLADGDYEYDFIVDGNASEPIADPYAAEIDRFGDYRGIVHVRNRRPWTPPFRWDDEIDRAHPLAPNERLVIYEMPLRWMYAGAESTREIGLGTFDRVIFDHLDSIADLGVNAIELLPVQDSPATLSWGYGSRFFFAPDYDMGDPTALKLLIKRCHQRGIRVILDVVMNHAAACPLEKLAYDWFFLPKPQQEESRGNDWGSAMFRFVKQMGGAWHAREFHYAAAEFLIEQYHVDGFRIDEFRGINNWDFIEEFRNRAAAAHARRLPGRPFVVIAEDSAQETKAVREGVVDAMWSFSFRDEVRRLMRNDIQTAWGQPSRRERVRAMLAGSPKWDDWKHSFDDGFDALNQSVNYVTSHDVEHWHEWRLVNHILAPRLGWPSLAAMRGAAENVPDDILRAIRGAFAIMLTSAGMAMFLAGEEFADVHDTDTADPALKMSDPVDWARQNDPRRAALRAAVRDLVRLRTSHDALASPKVDCFWFHPTFDDNDGVRVFAYCRTAGKPLGSAGQVVVVANCGWHDFPSFDLPWPWAAVTECAPAGPSLHHHDSWATLALHPFDVRVFASS